METKTMTIRVPQELATWLEKKEGSYNGSIVDALYTAMYTELYADREIKGKLTESEWKLLADSLNGTLIEGTFRFASSALVAHIEDADKFESVGERWSVDVAKLCEKIKDMSCSQIEAIYRRVEEFWNNPVDLDSWAKY